MSDAPFSSCNIMGFVFVLLGHEGKESIITKKKKKVEEEDIELITYIHTICGK